MCQPAPAQGLLGLKLCFSLPTQRRVLLFIANKHMQTKEHSSKCKTHCSAFLHCLQFFFSLFLGWVGKSDMWQKPTRKLADNCRRVIPLNTESFIMDIVLISSPGERRDIYHDENITLLTLVSAWHDPRHSKPYFIRLLSALDLSGGIPRFPGEAVRWLWQHVLSWEVLQLEALHWGYVRHEREREREREREGERALPRPLIVC